MVAIYIQAWKKWSQRISTSHHADTPRTRMKKLAPLRMSHSGPPNCFCVIAMRGITNGRRGKFLASKPQKTGGMRKSHAME